VVLALPPVMLPCNPHSASCVCLSATAQVDFAEDQDWDWVANKLQQLSDALGSSRVTVLPDRRGVQLFRAAVEGPGEQAAAGCGAGRRGAAVMVVHEKGQADSG
jgi:hypothetical protein